MLKLLIKGVPFLTIPKLFNIDYLGKTGVQSRTNQMISRVYKPIVGDVAKNSVSSLTASPFCLSFSFFNVSEFPSSVRFFVLDDIFNVTKSSSIVSLKY